MDKITFIILLWGGLETVIDFRDNFFFKEKDGIARN